MKILLLTQVVPFPPDSGPKIKTYNVMRHLAQHHEVHLISFARSSDEEAHAQALGRYCASTTTVRLRRSRTADALHLARSLVSGRPFLIERDDSQEMRDAIGESMGRTAFDAVHADQLSMAQFAVNLPLPLRVLDEHNAVWTIVRRAATREKWWLRRPLAELEWRKLKQYEGIVCRSFDRVTVVSDEDDRALTEAADNEIPSVVIPISVDTEELAYAPRTDEALQVTSVATMFYPPNVEGVHWFATEVFPLVRRALPATKFFIVGSRPPDVIARLATSESQIDVTGYVADLDPILRHTGVLVVPIHSGSGMRVKILEAFARGIPVVSTSIGVEGIDAKNHEHLLIADEPSEFARAIVQVLRDRDEGRKLAVAGRQLVEERYNWRSALRALDELYQLRGVHSDAGPVGMRCQRTS